MNRTSDRGNLRRISDTRCCTFSTDCVVCNHPITGRVYTVGDRSYCHEHYVRAFKRRGTWPTVWILFAGLVALGLLMQQVGPALTPLLNGGTLIVQYNKFEFNDAQYGPYPAKVGRERVTDENAELKLLAPQHPVFNSHH